MDAASTDRLTIGAAPVGAATSSTRSAGVSVHAAEAGIVPGGDAVTGR